MPLRVLSKSLRFMESILLTYGDDNDVASCSSPIDQSFRRPSFSDPGESLFLVPFRWWEEAVCSGGVFESGVGRGVLYSTALRLNRAVEDCGFDVMDVDGFGESEILLDMRSEGEVGISERGKEEETDSCGETLALVSEWMFFTALKWHYDKKNVGNLPGEDIARDLFSLCIRLLYVAENNLLVIKISEKDNEIGAFKHASRIFCSNSGTMQIWDFSGQTNQLFLDDRKLFKESDQSNQEILLELQIYGLSCSIKEDEMGKESIVVEQSMADGPSSTRINGCMDKLNLFSEMQPSFSSDSCYRRTCSLGLTGLYNLGNTCFMNSTLQCLVHTPKLVDYFLGNFRRDLNFENPLGMNGKLAITFGDLLRKLLAAGATAISPKLFKSTISNFAPQFGGYSQHDSQEFLAFLLDGLHEDLNRVKSKPYIQTKDKDGRPHEEVADEYWGNHLSRNDSIIVDLCQGQYRSTLFCPVCRKLSITFDPFMYLSLPLPSATLRKMTLTVLSTGEVTLPYPVTITVSKNGTFKNLLEALAEVCSLRDDETLIIAEIYKNSRFRLLEDSSDLVELIRDYDQLVAYRFPKDVDGSPLVVFMHQQEEMPPYFPLRNRKTRRPHFPYRKRFNIPLLTRMSDLSKGSEIRKAFLKLINPFLLSREECLNDDVDGNVNIKVFDEIEVANLDYRSEKNLDLDSDFEFRLVTETSYTRCVKKIQMDEPVLVSNFEKLIKVIVTWPEKMIQEYDTRVLSLRPEVCEPAFISKRDEDSVSLYKCVEAFLKEEPLGPDDMWYCPNCKEHRQASKKLDLWRLPEILVIHLKRFSYNRFCKNKLETFVDFPIDDFDISNYVIHNNDKVSRRYALYAVSNHYGSTGGGHYTAFVKHGDSWYEFDDRRVFPVAEEQIKTPAAYVLFYRRV